jgi:hypothetical protein
MVERFVRHPKIDHDKIARHSILEKFLVRQSNQIEIRSNRTIKARVT